VVPSIFSAVNIIRDTNFERNVETLVEKNKTIGRSYIFDFAIEDHGRNHSVQLFLAGEALADAEKESIYQDAEELGIKRNQLTFHEDATIKGGGIDNELLKNFYDTSEKKVQDLNATVNELNQELDSYKAKELPTKVIAMEIAAQYDGIQNVSVTRGETVNPVTGESADDIVILLDVDRALPQETIDKITNWLRVRLNETNVSIIQRTAAVETAAVDSVSVAE